MRKVLEVIGWRLVFAVALLSLVTTLAWSTVQTHREDQAKDQLKDQRIASLISLVQAQDSTFSSERHVLLGNVDLLLTYTRQLAQREDGLLQYLRAHGIKLPKELVTEIPPPVLIKVPVPAPRLIAPSGKATKGKGHKK
jgi:hypothetical protein